MFLFSKTSSNWSWIGKPASSLAPLFHPPLSTRSSGRRSLRSCHHYAIIHHDEPSWIKESLKINQWSPLRIMVHKKLNHHWSEKLITTDHHGLIMRTKQLSSFYEPIVKILNQSSWLNKSHALTILQISVYGNKLLTIFNNYSLASQCLYSW